jgi:Trk-type K+ transport system membrane component
MCNPITINTFVVFLRLYWFEKRFQNIVQDARSFRTTGTRTRSMAKTEEKDIPDIGQLEQGVGERKMQVMHKTSNSTDSVPVLRDELGQDPTPKPEKLNLAPKSKSMDRPKVSEDGNAPDSPLIRREIMFADEIKKVPVSITNEDRIPAPRPKEQHIAFVENQRNPKDNSALRIPGPRDVERGIVPERVKHDDPDSPERPHSIQSIDTASPDKANVPNPDSDSDEINQPQTFKERIGRLRNRFKRNSSPVSIRERAQKVTKIIWTMSGSREDPADPTPYLSYAPTLGRNSTFVDLTEEQREELGGIEYRSLKTLAKVLIGYNLGWSILGMIVLTPWIVRSAHYSSVVTSIGQSPPWWGIFTATSMFTDLGFTLTPDSMISFQQAWLPLLIGSWLIIIGNTGFPIILRFTIWVLTKIVPVRPGLWEELRFLLDHPRRCFTLLFPRKATWWLFMVLVILNGIDLVFFIILDLRDPTVTSLPGGYQFLDGLFQAVSTRTAGFACVNLADLHPGIQVSYLIMMYISVFPIAISVRKTNVYEEKSLGIYHNDVAAHMADNEGDDNDPLDRSYISSHLRRQLSFDLWYVFLGLFFICVIEGSRIEDTGQPNFSIFSILFEIISAYGTVGLSLGYPGTNASFSAQFKPLSKLIIIAMMLRGRHRGLPYALDRAILLPGEGLKNDKLRQELREENAAAALRPRQASTVPGGGAQMQYSGETNEDYEDRRGRQRQRSRSRVPQQLTRIMTGALGAGPTNVGKEKTF